MTAPFPSEIIDGYRLNPAEPDMIRAALDGVVNDNIFLPLLGEVGALLEGSQAVKILPAVYAAADPDAKRNKLGGISLIPASIPGLLPRQSDNDYFQPHANLRSKAEKWQKSNFPKADRHRHPSYLTESTRGVVDLYIDIDRHDPEQAEGHHLSDQVLERFGNAFNLGRIVVGANVVGGETLRAGVSMPTVVRELGTIILPLPYSLDVKRRILADAIGELSQNRSPDYRKYISRPGRPKRK